MFFGKILGLGLAELHLALNIPPLLTVIYESLPKYHYYNVKKIKPVPRLWKIEILGLIDDNRTFLAYNDISSSSQSFIFNFNNYNLKNVKIENC